MLGVEGVTGVTGVTGAGGASGVGGGAGVSGIGGVAGLSGGGAGVSAPAQKDRCKYAVITYTPSRPQARGYSESLPTPRGEPHLEVLDPVRADHAQRPQSRIDSQ